MRKRISSCSGQSLLEFAILLPLLFLLVVNVVNFGGLLYALHYRFKCGSLWCGIHDDGPGERERPGIAISCHSGGNRERGPSFTPLRQQRNCDRLQQQ